MKELILTEDEVREFIRKEKPSLQEYDYDRVNPMFPEGRQDVCVVLRDTNKFYATGHGGSWGGGIKSYGYNVGKSIVYLVWKNGDGTHKELLTSSSEDYIFLNQITANGNEIEIAVEISESKKHRENSKKRTIKRVIQ